jgi:hypothetical protein
MGGCSPQLGSLQEGFLNRLWQIYNNEALSRVQIVFAALVHDPEVAVCLSALVRQQSVDLVQLQRSRVPGIVYTYGELDGRFSLRHVLV